MKILTWAEEVGHKNCPYLIRYILDFYIFSIRLHHWLKSETDIHLHNHPFNFITIVLYGGYIDQDSSKLNERMIPGKIRYRSASHTHHVRVRKGGCWTLMFAGRKKFKWGFWVNNKFKKANKYFFEHPSTPCD